MRAPRVASARVSTALMTWGEVGGRTININYARLLTEKEIILVRDQFHQCSEFLFEESIINACKY